MALIQAEVDLANQSIGRIGGKQFSLSVQTGYSGEQANLHFDQTRDSLLRSYEWPFAKTRLTLSNAWATATAYITDQYVWEDEVAYKCAIAHTSGTFSTDLAAGKWTDVSATVESEFGFNYNLPADFIRLVEFIDDDEEDWQLEGNTIRTDYSEVQIVYVKDVDDTTEWDNLFVDMFIVKLALNLLNPLSGSGSGVLNLRQLLLKEFRLLSSQARSVASQEGNNSGYSNWHKSRFNSNWRTNIGV